MLVASADSRSDSAALMLGTGQAHLGRNAHVSHVT